MFLPLKDHLYNFFLFQEIFYTLEIRKIFYAKEYYVVPFFDILHKLVHDKFHKITLKIDYDDNIVLLFLKRLLKVFAHGREKKELHAIARRMFCKKFYHIHCKIRCHFLGNNLRIFLELKVVD